MRSFIRLFCIFCFTVSSAHAGFYGPNPVTINNDSNFAYGDLNTARFSTNDVELMGCRVWRFEGGFSYGQCEAADANEQLVNCWTLDSNLLQAMEALAGGPTFVSFGWRDFDPLTDDPFLTGENVCRNVSVGVRSRYIWGGKESKGR